MRILSIELHGFKSFARKEVIEFATGVTCIVGPNGCGKSNVVDALRWVLGEQSRKDLRMKASTDVVFGGSAKRPGAKYASVTVTFDNSGKLVQSMGAEFSIARILTANGDSSYRINDQEATRTQIRELFRGTGVGPDGFTIMEQGKIDALLQTNPVERRKTFEEAAGIAGYRDQKASTEAKLEVVAQNLLRLADKINEAKSRLRAIKGQASRALKYKEYTERLRLLRTSVALRHFHELGQQRETTLVAIREIGREEGQVMKELATLTMEVESAAARLAEKEAGLAKLRKQYQGAEDDVRAGEQRRSEARAGIEILKGAAQRLSAETLRLDEQISALERRKEELQGSTQSSRLRLTQADSELKTSSGQETELVSEGKRIEGVLRNLRETHIEVIHRKSALLNQRMALETEIKATTQRKLALERRRNDILGERNNLGQALARIEQTFGTDNARLEQLKAEHERVEAAISEHNTSLQELRSERHALELKLSGCASRISHLEDVERMLDGVDEGSRALVGDAELRQRYGVIGLMAEAVSADISVAPALEAALGPLADAVIVEKRAQAIDAIEYLAKREGAAATVVVRDHFIGKARTPDFPTGTGILGPLRDQVTVAKGLEGVATHLLGDWLLVADRDVAARLSRKHGGALKLVTPTGDVFGDGVCRLPSSDRSGGIITQRSELRRLRKEHAKLQKSAEDMSARISTSVEAAKATEAEATALRARIYEANVAVLESRTERDHLGQRLSSLETELATIDSEMTELTDTVTQDRTRLDEVAVSIEEQDRELARIEKDIEGTGKARTAHESRRSVLSEKVTSQRIEVASISSQLSAIESSATELERTIQSFRKRLEENAREQESGKREIARLEAEIVRSQAAQADLLAARDRMAAELKSCEAALFGTSGDTDALRAKERGLHQSLLAIKERISQHKVEEQKLAMGMENIRDRLTEDYSLDIDILYRDYNAAADATNVEDANNEIETLLASIKRLGAVNMEAVDELEEVEERYNACSRQEKDLVRAKQALEDAIARIENEARARFVRTFETVRGHFQGLFRKMFNGGSADIVLLNPEDVLSSGIEVIAKPPGMEPKSLNLLSGGQRTMIAVALMFALFETSSAPFAMLDEVDAALDDANVDRFCTVLREYAQRSQFVVITHHKKTMIHADCLHGVTMQEPGISKKVSVDLEAWDPQAAQTEMAASVG